MQESQLLYLLMTLSIGHDATRHPAAPQITRDLPVNSAPSAPGNALRCTSSEADLKPVRNLQLKAPALPAGMEVSKR